MENASKALIIAGAILLSILIIGLGMAIYQQAAGAMNGANMDPTKIQAYNSEFLNYEGTQSGTQVRALLDTVRSHNLAHTDDPSLNVTVMTSTAAGVTAAPTAVVTATDVNNVKKTINAGKTYTVDFLEHSKKENKGEVEFIYTSNHHEPIIDRDLFEATQRELKRRSEIYKHEKSKYTNKHTFSGKLVCACCGSSYVGGENRKRKDGTIRKTWRCYTATKYGKKHEENGQDIGCNNDRVNNETLKICFMKALKEVLINKKEIKKETEQYIKLVLNKCGQETQLNDILVKDKEQLMKERSRLLDLCIKGIVDEETFSLKNNEIIEKINKIEIELDSQKQKVRMKENAEEILEKIQKTIDNILNIKKFSKNVCKEFVDKIVIYNDKKFDFYLKGYDTSFNFNEESNISYLPHW